MRRAWILTVASLWLVLAAPRTASATTLTVGLFAPSAPFSGTEARLDYVSRLAKHLAAATGHDEGVGRVYAKASDLLAAVKRGDLQLAVLDAAYLAQGGAGYQVLAVALRGGASAGAWELVAVGGGNVLGLAGKTLIVPSTGGREEDFVLHALLESEVARGFFAKIIVAPDAASAVASLGVGKADAACVPAGMTLPAGTSRVTSLPQVDWPLLVALPGLDAQAVARAAEAAQSFAGGDVLSGFRAADAGVWRKLARRFQKLVKRGPMVVPALKLAVGALLEGRGFSVARPAAAGYLATPAR